MPGERTPGRSVPPFRQATFSIARASLAGLIAIAAVGMALLLAACQSSGPKPNTLDPDVKRELKKTLP